MLVRRGESGSKGWWFRTELGRSLVTGSKLRLPPLNEGHEDGEEIQVVEVVVAAATATMTMTIEVSSASAELVPRNFGSFHQLYRLLSVFLPLPPPSLSFQIYTCSRAVASNAENAREHDWSVGTASRCCNQMTVIWGRR